MTMVRPHCARRSSNAASSSGCYFRSRDPTKPRSVTYLQSADANVIFGG